MATGSGCPDAAEVTWHVLVVAEHPGAAVAARLWADAAAGAAGGDEGGTSPEFVPSSSEELYGGGTATPRRELRCRSSTTGPRGRILPLAAAVPKRQVLQRRA